MEFELTDPQFDFFDLQCAYPLFVGGYGSGKTFVKIVIGIQDLLQNPGCDIAFYDPIFDLIRLNTAPRTLEALDSLGIRHTYNKSEQIIHVHDYGNIILRSMDNPARIVAYEVFRSGVDELETLRPQQAIDAWSKIIARNRQQSPTGAINQVRVYTTPDMGFGFTYEHWKLNKRPGYEYVRAPTASNINLDPTYIENLRATYPAQMAEAFIEGEWCNLTAGTIYNAFDRIRSNSSEKIQPGEQLYIGMDFNVTNMTAVVTVNRDGVYHAVEELTGVYDTPSMISLLKEKYIGHRMRVYPDASGGSRKTVDASISDISLLEAGGFVIYSPTKNPLVKDRIVSVNAAFEHGKVFVNVDRCPELARCLEQQAWGKNGEPDKSQGLDHSPDAFGYFIHYELPVVRPVAGLKIKWAM
jgi:phage terminase large subunit